MSDNQQFVAYAGSVKTDTESTMNTFGTLLEDEDILHLYYTITHRTLLYLKTWLK